jgi:hypothetical protein
VRIAGLWAVIWAVIAVIWVGLASLASAALG